jgi:hypothetical protein
LISETHNFGIKISGESDGKWEKDNERNLKLKLNTFSNYRPVGAQKTNA